MRTILCIALAAALAGCTGCGDDAPGDDDGDDDTVMPDAGPDGGDPPATFTTFVIDVIENQTADNTNAIPSSAFSDLEDVDTDNPSAYDPLFP